MRHNRDRFRITSPIRCANGTHRRMSDVVTVATATMHGLKVRSIRYLTILDAAALESLKIARQEPFCAAGSILQAPSLLKCVASWGCTGVQPAPKAEKRKLLLVATVFKVVVESSPDCTELIGSSCRAPML